MKPIFLLIALTAIISCSNDTTSIIKIDDLKDITSSYKISQTDSFDNEIGLIHISCIATIKKISESSNPISYNHAIVSNDNNLFTLLADGKTILISDWKGAYKGFIKVPTSTSISVGENKIILTNFQTSTYHSPHQY